MHHMSLSVEACTRVLTYADTLLMSPILKHTPVHGALGFVKQSHCVMHAVCTNAVVSRSLHYSDWMDEVIKTLVLTS